MVFDPLKIRGLILDMDGVLWRSNETIGDLPTLFAEINKLGLKVVLATNNATKSIQQFLTKLESFGVSRRVAPSMWWANPDWWRSLQKLDSSHPKRNH